MYEPDREDVLTAAASVASVERIMRELRVLTGQLRDELSRPRRDAIEVEVDALIGSVFAHTGRAYFHLTRQPHPPRETQARHTVSKAPTEPVTAYLPSHDAVTITRLTGLNIRALSEVFADAVGDGRLYLTATTARFDGLTHADVEARMAELPTGGHPRQSLHAVARKLRAAEAA